MQISNIKNYTLDDLQVLDELVSAEGRKLGLRPPEILYHLVPPETIYTVAARGIPGRYSHSDFGRAYEQMKNPYDRGQSRIYEIIFNAIPAQGYLMEGNGLVEQLMVLAHCYLPGTPIWTTDGVRDIASIEGPVTVKNHRGELVSGTPTKRAYSGPTIRLMVAGESFESTPEHQYLVHNTAGGAQSWREAQDLELGDRLVMLGGRLQLGAPVEAIETCSYQGFVHCLQVPDGHSFTLCNGIVTHNCQGHAHVFVNNAFNQPSDKQFAARVRAAAERVENYYRRYGRLEVEDFITTCNALVVHEPVDRLSRRPTPREPVFEERRWDVLDPEAAEARRKRYHEEREAFRRRFPQEPEREILRFIGEHSRRLEDWQRDLISIVRSEHEYFAPMYRTKVLHEGLSSWAEDKIVDGLDLDDSAYLEYRRFHAKIVQPHGLAPSPYNLGLELFREVERLAAGKDLTDEERERWDWAGSADPHAKVIEIADSYSDSALVAEFLTARVCERCKLFAWEHEPGTKHQVRVSTREADAIRERLVHEYAQRGIPRIEIVDGDGRARGELWLEHRHEGLGLDEEYTRGTLKLVTKMWGKTCVVRSVDKDGKDVWFICDGSSLAVSTRTSKPS